MLYIVKHKEIVKTEKRIKYTWKKQITTREDISNNNEQDDSF